MESSTKLSSEVYSALMRVPRGKVTTYGELAKAIGRPRASRAVGKILNKNPDPITVPCHRVVMSNGAIGGYALGKATKRALLESEGLSFSGEKVAEFRKSLVDARMLV